jgi:acyl-CoA synthetase (AMP-forming)/AMP-acid ligase II
MASTFPTLVHLLRARAVQQPNRRALTFLPNGEREGLAHTYGELDRQSRAVATRLERLGVGVGERALLLYPPGLDYVVGLLGCFYAGLIAVPAYPADSARFTRSLPRLLSIIQDAQPAVVLTTTTDLAAAVALSQQTCSLRTVQWLTSDDIDSTLSDEWRQPSLQPDSLALIQYTSGSTHSPRGAMVMHENLMHNLDFIRRRFEITPSDTGVIWLPPYHDMGLIGGILGAFYCGNPLILMPPVAFLKRPLRWLEVISRSHAVISGGPNFAYDLCIRRINAEDRARLDLSNWAVAFTGAEPIRAHTLDRFAEAFKESGFRREAFVPCYGLAEATLMASAGHKKDAPTIFHVRRSELEHNRIMDTDNPDATTVSLVSCGQPDNDQELLIVDPETAVPCPSDRVGEIWLSGQSIVQGYWNRPEESRRTFQAFRGDTGQGPYFRTGDLGFKKDNCLLITGRLKALIICDGRNHYAEDIELTVEQSHPALRPGGCVAFSIEVEDKEELVILSEPSRAYKPVATDHQGDGDSSKTSREALYLAVRKAIQRAVADNHGLRAHTILLLKPGELFKTSSGKIQREACRSSFLRRTLTFMESAEAEISQ